MADVATSTWGLLSVKWHPPLLPWLAQLLWCWGHPLAGALPQWQGTLGSSDYKEGPKPKMPPTTTLSPPSPSAAVTLLHALPPLPAQPTPASRAKEGPPSWC